jgi:D-arabinose 1-dehydrogenase-like Zn-dependent alcohol dehydrogenase
MLMNGYTLGTSLVATRQVHVDMLDFAARNEIKPTVETFDMTADGFAKALEKLTTGKMKYRGVLVAQ